MSIGYCCVDYHPVSRSIGHYCHIHTVCMLHREVSSLHNGYGGHTHIGKHICSNLHLPDTWAEAHSGYYPGRHIHNRYPGFRYPPPDAPTGRYKKRLCHMVQPHNQFKNGLISFKTSTFSLWMKYIF